MEDLRRLDGSRLAHCDILAPRYSQAPVHVHFCRSLDLCKDKNGPQTNTLMSTSSSTGVVSMAHDTTACPLKDFRYASVWIDAAPEAVYKIVADPREWSRRAARPAEGCGRL
jgi:hypothetical protein